MRLAVCRFALYDFLLLYIVYIYERSTAVNTYKIK
jgi:hypothetical protein